MARKPENTFIASVNRHLPPEVYSEKTANPYRGGTPDEYYEGNQDILWIEYKYLRALPPELNLSNPKAPTCCSPLQLRWLKRAYENGRNVAVILGTPMGGFIYRYLDWMETYSREILLEHRLLSRKEIAQWIVSQTMSTPSPSLTKAPRKKSSTTTATTK